jgi:hypothetical protein
MLSASSRPLAERPSKTDSRAAALGTSEMLWTRDQCAAFLGISVRTLNGLPIPRAMVGDSPRFIPSIVRQWAEMQLSHRLPGEAA